MTSRIFQAAMVLLLSVLLFSAPVSAQPAKPTIFIVGDSISDPLRYSYSQSAGKRVQAYGSKLAGQLGARTIVSAQGGSGFLKHGYKDCRGSNFAGRLNKTTSRQIKHADVMIIEGGRNDFHTCDANGASISTTRAEITAAVTAYMDQIATLRANKPGTTYVMTPWGEQLGEEHDQKITPIVRAAATSHGFTFINTNKVLDPDFKKQNTIDGVHPDNNGTTALAEAIVNRSDIKQRIQEAKN